MKCVFSLVEIFYIIDDLVATLQIQIVWKFEHGGEINELH